MTDQNQVLPKDGDTTPNPEIKAPEITDGKTPKDPAEDPVDYKVKFGESSKEALRLLEENKSKDAEIARLAKIAEQSGASYGDDPKPMFPGFEELDEGAKKNLIEFQRGIRESTLKEVYNDPAIAFAKTTYNEKRWDEAFNSVSDQYPELKDAREDFKTKYFRNDNVPQNIGDILKDVAKVYLFDKAQDIGAQRAREQDGRLDIERSRGGDKEPKASRTLEDWSKMAESNPAEFAKHSKEFREDMAAGKLK